MNTAQLITDNLPDWQGHAAHYRLTPPYDGCENVVVSSIDNAFATETLAFIASPDGTVNAFLELFGYRGGTSHARAFTAIGYEIRGA